MASLASSYSATFVASIERERESHAKFPFSAMLEPCVAGFSIFEALRSLCGRRVASHDPPPCDLRSRPSMCLQKSCHHPSSCGEVCLLSMDRATFKRITGEHSRIPRLIPPRGLPELNLEVQAILVRHLMLERDVGRDFVKACPESATFPRFECFRFLSRHVSKQGRTGPGALHGFLESNVDRYA